MLPQFRCQLLIALVAAVVFFTNLGTPRLWDRDEPRNAGCAAEMLERGDCVVPVFNAELRTHKPVLLYWLMMAAYAAFGVNEFSARFWSAVLGVGTVLMTYHIGQRMFNKEVGIWGALILTSCMMFNVSSRAATPDSLLIFFATSALLLYVLGTFKPRSESAEGPLAAQLRTEGQYFPTSWPVVAAMYALMGVAMLAKGPVGLVLPVAVIGMFLLVVRLPARGEPAAERNRARRWLGWVVGLARPFAPLHFLRTCWRMRPLTALAVSLAVALPWYVLVGLRTDGEWTEGFFLTHNVGRALQPMENHAGSILYYPITLLVGLFPWSVFLTPTLIGLGGRISRHDPWRAGYVFTACWGGVYIGLFSIARTKLPSYITPSYPAFALMTGCFVYHFSRSTTVASRVWLKMGFGSLAAVGVGILVALPLLAWRFLPGDQWLGLLGLVPIGGGIACLLLLRTGRLRHCAATFTAVSLLFATVLFGFVGARVSRHQQNQALVDAIAARSPHPSIASFGCLEPSWVFYARRPIRQISSKSPDQAGSFLEDGGDSFLITSDYWYERLEAVLPEDARVLATVPYFLKKDRLLVIGRAAELEHTAGRPSTANGARR